MGLLRAPSSHRASHTWGWGKSFVQPPLFFLRGICVSSSVFPAFLDHISTLQPACECGGLRSLLETEERTPQAQEADFRVGEREKKRRKVFTNRRGFHM